MAKLWLLILSLLCGFCLFFSVFVFAVPGQNPEKRSPAPYILRDYGGHPALFRPGEVTPIQVYELYTHLLPAADIVSLQAGIPLQDEAELCRLLEDFGA